MVRNGGYGQKTVQGGVDLNTVKAHVFPHFETFGKVTFDFDYDCQLKVCTFAKGYYEQCSGLLEAGRLRDNWDRILYKDMIMVRRWGGTIAIGTARRGYPIVWPSGLTNGSIGGCIVVY